METALTMDIERNWGPVFAPQTSRRFEQASYEQAEIRAGATLGDGLQLAVTGTVPAGACKVVLVPNLNENMPEYREIAVRAEFIEGCAAARDERFEILLPLVRLSGIFGIELVGANSRKRFDLDGRALA